MFVFDFTAFLYALFFSFQKKEAKEQKDGRITTFIAPVYLKEKVAPGKWSITFSWA